MHYLFAKQHNCLYKLTLGDEVKHIDIKLSLWAGQAGQACPFFYPPWYVPSKMEAMRAYINHVYIHVHSHTRSYTKLVPVQLWKPKLHEQNSGTRVGKPQMQ